jgi:hypothetical protein
MGFAAQAATAAAALVLFVGGTALAEPAVRTNTVPAYNNDFGNPNIRINLGDLWTFKCPRNGSVTISVDTIEDGAVAMESKVDPALAVYDGAGNLLGSADDTQDCTYDPTCGFQCPAITVDCGAANPHSVSVFQASNLEQGCDDGGYVLSVEAFDANGQSIAAKKLQLGGGAKRKVPRWLDPARQLAPGPALDDEAVPFSFP